MDDGIARRARDRFDTVRDNAVRRLVDDPSALGAGAPAPSGWCVSSVARLVRARPSDVAGEAVAAVARAQRRLDAAGVWQHYPASALHVSLLGCTRREPHPQLADGAGTERLEQIVRCVEEHRPPVTRLFLGRLNLVGAQAFVEVVPFDAQWASARRRLADALRAVGEDPLSHPDTEPVHLNVSRLQRLDHPEALAALLSDPVPVVNLVVEVRTVEVVVTDFVLSPDATTVVRSVPLDQAPDVRS